MSLHARPPTVVEIVPYYRSYRYFVVDDRICIVDPATYEIVYIIDDSGPRVRTAQLVLTDNERRFIVSQLDVSRPTADISLRLALGAEIPNRFELLVFSDRIVTRVPKVREFRYVIADRSVAIVDPDDREVVVVIEG